VIAQSLQAAKMIIIHMLITKVPLLRPSYIPLKRALDGSARGPTLGEVVPPRVPVDLLDGNALKLAAEVFAQERNNFLLP
jgi:hypothetical protein